MSTYLIVSWAAIATGGAIIYIAEFLDGDTPSPLQWLGFMAFNPLTLYVLCITYIELIAL